MTWVLVGKVLLIMLVAGMVYDVFIKPESHKRPRVTHGDRRATDHHTAKGS
jgi:hypothetical protein